MRELHCELAALRFRLALKRYIDRYAKANFNPTQPRVPAGNPDGGQWTRVEESTAGGGETADTPTEHREIVEDRTGEEPWAAFINEFGADGSLSGQFVVNRDGSQIWSQFSSQGNAGWDERHTVRLSDGSVTVFDNYGTTQTIFGDDGQRLSEVVWTSSGLEPQASVQPVLWQGPAAGLAIQGGRFAIQKGIEAAAALFTWLSSRNSADSTAAIAFQAVEFRGEALGAPLFWVGQLSQADTRKACPELGTVQSLTDKAAASANQADYTTDAAYGTAVHTELRDSIRNLERDYLTSEVSLLKTKAETGEEYKPFHQSVRYGKKGSLRIDVLENAGNGTVCIYDIKTGESGLTAKRIAEIARAGHLRYPEARRFIVIEVRPR